MARRINPRVRTRVLITTDFYKPHANGVSAYVQHLVNALDSKRYDVTILTYGATKQRVRDGATTIIRIPRFRFVGDAFRVPRIGVRIPRCEIVITNTRFFTLSFLGAVLAKRWQARHVHIEHGAMHVPHSKAHVRSLAWTYDQTIGRAVLSMADAVVTVSRAGLAFVRKLGARRTVVIPNAVDEKQFHASAAAVGALRKRLRIPAEHRVVLFVGRLVKEKGVHELVEALRGLPQVTLVCVGDGPTRSELARDAARAHASARFVKTVPSSQLAPYYALADVFVNPSWAEGLPTVVLESLAAKTPVLATDVGGTREILPKQCLLTPRDVPALRTALARVLARAPRRTALPRRYTVASLQRSWNELLG